MEPLVLLEVEPIPRKILFREVSGFCVRLIKVSAIFFILFMFVPDPWQMMGFPAAAIICSCWLIIRGIHVWRRQIYKVELKEGDILNFYYLNKKKPSTFSLEKDNFRIRYIRYSKDYPGFLIEQRKPYKWVFMQYAIGNWSSPDAMDFLKEYGIVQEYK
jgi:hypothetical protein